MDMIVAFETVTGRRLGLIPASDYSWSASISNAGSLSVKVPLSLDTQGLDLRSLLQPWRTTLAIITPGGKVSAAGPVYRRDWDADSQLLSIECGSAWDLLKRRLVIPPAQANYQGGTLAGKDGSYGTDWDITLRGSLPSIARDLVQLTLDAAPLPIVLPPREDGYNTRTYTGPDLATIEARLSDLTQVINGPEILFDPRLNTDKTSLSWVMLAASPELVTATHHWDARRSTIPLISVAIQEDAATMTNDAWARAGEQQDQTLIAHHHDQWMQANGWPLLQTADTSHNSVSDLGTLTGYTQVATQMRARSLEVITLKARRSDETTMPLGAAVTPGDHIHLRVNDPYLGDYTYSLKALETSGDTSDWITIHTRETTDAL